MSTAKLLGRTQPRLWTPPRCTLTRRTSLGYDVADFAEKIGYPLLPWQRWFAIHALELDADDHKRLRFRQVLGMTGLQNGKTRVAAVIALYKLHVMSQRLVLAVAQDLAMAREGELAALDMIQSCPWLACDLAEVRRGNGNEWFRVAPGGAIGYDDSEDDESFTLSSGGRFKIAASNRKAGRGLSVDHLYIDELAQWHSPAPWSALRPTTTARPNSQTLMITNAGDDHSVVLNTLREAALSGQSPHIGLFEWSAADGCELDDIRAWRQANPGLGYTIKAEAIETAMHSDLAPTFRAETLCQRVDQLDGAVSFHAWQACEDKGVTLDGYRDRLAACFDVALDSSHATLAVARLADGRARVEIAGAWHGTEAARSELPGLLARIKPLTVAWFPSGPAGAFSSLLRPPEPGRHVRGPAYLELTGTTVAEVSMQLSDLVASRRITHPGDQLLDAQITHAGKTQAADGWRFSRKGAAHVDAVYASAGAIAAALSLPAPRRARIRLLG